MCPPWMTSCGPSRKRRVLNSTGARDTSIINVLVLPGELWRPNGYRWYAQLLPYLAWIIDRPSLEGNAPGRPHDVPMLQGRAGSRAIDQRVKAHAAEQGARGKIADSPAHDIKL